MKTIDLEPVYTPSEVADYLRCSPSIVMSLIDRGALKARVLTFGKKKMRRITKSALLEYISGADTESQAAENCEVRGSGKVKPGCISLPRKRHFKSTGLGIEKTKKEASKDE